MLLYAFVKCVSKLCQVVSAGARLYHVVKLVSNFSVLLKIFNPYVIIFCCDLGNLAANERLTKSSIAIKIAIGGSVRLY